MRTIALHVANSPSGRPPAPVTGVAEGEWRASAGRSELLALDVADVKNGKGVKTVVTLRPETTKGGKGGEIVIAEWTRRG